MACLASLNSISLPVIWKKQTQCLFAGDYVWQGKQFERAILGYRKQGLFAHIWNIYNYVTSLAIFHPIQLRDQPDTTANRFYLLIEKQCT